MFDSSLSAREINKRFFWQTVREIAKDNGAIDGVLIIKDYIKNYGGHFGKIIRINKIRYILIYFNNEDDIMNAVYKSAMEG